MFSGDGEHHYCADCGEDGDEGDGEAFALEARGAVGGAENCEDLDCAEGDVEEDGLEVCVAEVFDYQIAEGGDAAACYAV